MLLAVGFPVIALIGGAATYGLVGRSLRPVERMRTQVSAISTADLSERVAVPAARDEISRLAQTMNAMLARIEAGTPPSAASSETPPTSCAPPWPR